MTAAATGRGPEEIRPRTRWSRTRAWIADHAAAVIGVVAVPLAASWLLRDTSDWLSLALGLGGGLCWSGVLLPAAVREPTVLLAGAVTAMSGALLSIVLSQSVESPAASGRDVAPMLLATLLAGSAALYGQHRNGAEQRAASRELVELVRQITMRQDADLRELTALIRANADAERHPRRSALTRLVAIWSRPLD